MRVAKQTHNKVIREAATAAHVPLYLIGDAIGVCDMTIYRRLRKPLSEAETAEWLQAIAAIAAEQAETEANA